MSAGIMFKSFTNRQQNKMACAHSCRTGALPRKALALLIGIYL